MSDVDPSLPAEPEIQDHAKENMLGLMPFVEALGEPVDENTYVVADDIRVRRFDSGVSEFELQRRSKGGCYSDFLPDTSRGETLRLHRAGNNHFVLGPDMHKKQTHAVSDEMFSQLVVDLSLYPWAEDQESRPASRVELERADVVVGDVPYAVLSTRDFWTVVRTTEVGYERMDYAEIEAVLSSLAENAGSSDMAEAV